MAATQTVSIEVPEKVLRAEKTDALAFVREMRVLAAVKLYELGRLLSGRAAELAGYAAGRVPAGIGELIYLDRIRRLE